MNLRLNALQIRLRKEGRNVRIVSGLDNAIFPERNLVEMNQILQENFNFVRAYFEGISMKIDVQELDEICFSITLDHLYTYNVSGQKEMRLSQRDMEHPQTDDVIFAYFKKKYSKQWLQKSADMLGVDLAECKKRYEAREEFMDR